VRVWVGAAAGDDVGDGTAVCVGLRVALGWLVADGEGVFVTVLAGATVEVTIIVGEGDMGVVVGRTGVGDAG
jgi:hypothetical protein